MPEGFAGDIEEDFAKTGERSWMVRDSARALCQIIDAYPAKNAGGPSTAVLGDSPMKSEQWRSWDLAGYTDRPEWPSCVLNGQVYGRNVIDTPKLKGKLKDNVLDAMAGEQTETTSADFHIALKKCLGEDVSMPSKVLVTGAKGAGKSIALNQAVLHARMSGWLCLFVPNGWDHVQMGAYVEPVRGQKGVYDNPLMTAQLLRNFHAAHKEQLASIPVGNMDVFNKYGKFLSSITGGWNRALQVKGREDFDFIKMRQIVTEEEFPDEDILDEPLLNDFDFLSFEPKTLLDLLLIGVAFRDNAGQVIYDVVNELKNLESVPVLLAVDQYNTWEAPSAYQYRDKQLHGFNLAVPNALKFISKTKTETASFQVKNGMCIAAVSSKHPAEGGLQVFNDIASSVPLTLNIPSFSKQEFVSVMTHYTEKKIITVDLTRSDLTAFRSMTGSTGREMRREVSNYFYPLESMNVLEEMAQREVRYTAFEDSGEKKVDRSSSA